MPKSKGRKKKPPARQRAKRSPTVSRLPPMASLVRPVLDGGRELLDMADPLDVEMWASDILSLWFKVPLPLVDQEEFERKIRNQIVRSAETKASAEAVAVLCAFTAMEPDPIARPATDAIARLTARGAVLPPWAEALNDGPEQVSGWMLTHPFGDQDGYHLDFRYPGHEAHTIVALIDKNIGGICKDAVCGIASDTIRARAEADGDVDVRDVDPIEAAPAILQAIEIGDQYIDNDWTPEFKTTRALLRARMHRLARDRRPDIREPLTDQKRDAIVGEFLREVGEGHEAAERIAELAVDYACDYTPDGDPFRWSPIVVECFLLGWLPRKALLDTGEIRAIPGVLKSWVGFALRKRGLKEPLIEESKAAVDDFFSQFRQLATDQKSFGPAKAIANAMMASGVDLSDQNAVNEWIVDFNSRPFEERDELLGPAIEPR